MSEDTNQQRLEMDTATFARIVAQENARLRDALARYVCDCSDLCQLYDGWCEEGKELLPRMVCGQWAREALGNAARAEVESKPFEERWDNA